MKPSNKAAKLYDSRQHFTLKVKVKSSTSLL